MRFHLYRLSLGGAISLGHLLLVAALFIITREQNQWSNASAQALLVLLFPLSLVFIFSFGSHSWGSEITILFCFAIPLNSYLWGHTIGSILRHLIETPEKRRARLIEQCRCPHCNYDLRASRQSERCSECGHPIPHELRLPPTPPDK